MKKLIVTVVGLPVAVIGVFFGLGLYSSTGQPPGVAGGKLAPCPTKPNCVSSESSPSDPHAIAGIEITPTMGREPLLKVRDAISILGGEVSVSNSNYLAATFTSPLFKFIDDVEFRVDVSANMIHVRSASRVGYSDLNANRERVENLKRLLSPPDNSADTAEPGAANSN